MGILQEEAAGQHACAHHGAPQAAHPKCILETCMHVLTTAPLKPRIRSASSRLACMCSPRRPSSRASEVHPRDLAPCWAPCAWRYGETMGFGAMLGAMRLAVWRDHGGGVLDHGRFKVGSRRNVPAAAARADVQCTIGIIRAPHINSRGRARYDVCLVSKTCRRLAL